MLAIYHVSVVVDSRTGGEGTVPFLRTWEDKPSEEADARALRLLDVACNRFPPFARRPGNARAYALVYYAGEARTLGIRIGVGSRWVALELTVAQKKP